MKCVLISGSSGGMGLATVKKLIENGYFVFGVDIKETEYHNENFRFIKTDIRDIKSIESAYEEVRKITDEIDAIINMSGIYDLNSLIEISEEDFIKIFDINVFGAYRLNKVFSSMLVDKGKIIITSSELAPLYPLPFTGIYAITKKTIEGYADSLRMELQLLDKYVSVIRPGAVDTTLLDVSTEKVKEFTNTTTHYQYNSERFKRIVDKVESRKVSPEKIANLALKILKKKKPKYVYKINRNPLLLIFNILLKRMQNHIIKRILMKK